MKSPDPFRHNVECARTNWIGSYEVSGPVELAELSEQDKARWVIYTPHHAAGSFSDPGRERGVISSWNSKFVFVKYGFGDTAAATDPSQLEFCI